MSMSLKQLRNNSKTIPKRFGIVSVLKQNIVYGRPM